MADDKHYVPGSFYRICDITGFKVRAEKTKKMWNGFIRREQSWNPRQPQDFVRGVMDWQNVPEPRPRQVNVFLGPLETRLTARTNAGEVLVNVESTIRMDNGDVVHILMDNGSYFYTTIDLLLGTTSFNVSSPFPYWASADNIMYDITAYSNPSLTLSPSPS